MHYKYIHNFLMYENFFKNLETKKTPQKSRCFLRKIFRLGIVIFPLEKEIDYFKGN